MANYPYAVIRDGTRLFKGIDPDTGESISGGERAFSTIGLIPGVGSLKKAGNLGKILRATDKGSSVGKATLKTRLPRTNGKWIGEPGNGK